MYVKQSKYFKVFSSHSIQVIMMGMDKFVKVALVALGRVYVSVLEAENQKDRI